MPATYEPIATTTLGSAASSITFSSIPGTYTDLRLILVTNDGDSGNGGALSVTLNSVTTTTYSATYIDGDGATASSGRYTNFPYINAGPINGATGTLSFYDINFFSYAGSTNKSVLSRNSSDRNGAGTVTSTVALWRNTAAISSITIQSNNAPTRQLIAGTTATLYGILKA